MGRISGKSVGQEGNRGAQSSRAGIASGRGCGAQEKKLGSRVKSFAFSTPKNAGDVFLLFWHVFVLVYLYIYTHILSFPQTRSPKYILFPQPASFCTLQKYRQKNEIKFLIIAKSSETNIISTGLFFFPPNHPHFKILI